MLISQYYALFQTSSILLDEASITTVTCVMVKPQLSWTVCLSYTQQCWHCSDAKQPVTEGLQTFHRVPY